MSAKITPFPSQGRVRLVPIDAADERLPVAVRQLLAVIEAKDHQLASLLDCQASIIE